MKTADQLMFEAFAIFAIVTSLATGVVTLLMLNVILPAVHPDHLDAVLIGGGLGFVAVGIGGLVTVLYARRWPK